MYSIKFTDKALDDYSKIKKYLKLFLDSKVLEKIIDTIDEKIVSLSEMPRRFMLYGKKRIYHRMPVKKFVVLYKVDDLAQIVTIVGIFYGGIDIDKIAIE